ncbi:hypothetical protein [Tsukamurella pseudospumae]|uniref:ABC3 transporter permease protein domain-containing protein n=1 Tax=Tsukamurella pseudospumae TaxID=239498 RepID=A0A137ZCG9_9ACTN|nr:hypothetical protein [Tsukamurella pseudospumae]KXO95882.1 hypothetical protein AXK61_04300 [Tsukamurella pseudospumae]
MLTLIFLLPLIPLAVLAVIARLIYVLVTTDTTAPRTPEARRASRSVAVALGVSSALAIAAATALIATDELGRGLLLAFPVALFVLQVGLAVATAIIGSAVRSRGTARAASLTTRRVSDTAPRKLLTATLVGAVIALTFAGIGCAVASDDDAGRSRAFSSPGEYGGVEITTPFTGAYYAVPVMIVVLASTALAIATIVGARRWGALDQAELDIMLRVGVSTRTIAATAVSSGILLVVLGWSLMVAALQVAHSTADSTLWTIGQYAFPAGAAFGFALGVWGFLAFLVPNRPRKTGASAAALREVRA